MKKSQKLLIESSVLLTAISLKAKKTGKSLKEYFYEEETIKHITLVLYDLLPLSVKIGMRYEKFHEIFERNFKGIRNALLGKEQEVDVIQEPVEKVKRTPRKTVASKTPAKKVVTAKKPRVIKVKKDEK